LSANLISDGRVNGHPANNDFEFFKRDPSLNSPPGQQPPDTAPPVGKDNQCMGPGEFKASPGDQFVQPSVISAKPIHVMILRLLEKVKHQGMTGRRVI